MTTPIIGTAALTSHQSTPQCPGELIKQMHPFLLHYIMQGEKKTKKTAHLLEFCAASFGQEKERALNRTTKSLVKRRNHSTTPQQSTALEQSPDDLSADSVQPTSPHNTARMPTHKKKAKPQIPPSASVVVATTVDS